MTTKMSLYSASLEAHMKAYYDEVKLDSINQDYQLLQNKIIREAQLMNLSQADMINKLTNLQKEIQNQIKHELIPLSKTNSPELSAPKPEQYIPMTTSEYENKINKKPIYKVSNRKDLIDELKKKNRKKIFIQDLAPLNVNAPYSHEPEKNKKSYKPYKTYYKKTGTYKIETPLEGLLTEQGLRKLPPGRVPILTEGRLNTRTETYEKSKNSTTESITSGNELKPRNANGQFIKKK